MYKDRRKELPLDPHGNVEIVYSSSSARPTEYAIVLRVRRNGRWVAVVSADNAHHRASVDEHHMHRYAEGVKGSGESLPFPVGNTNDAMSKVIDWMADNWGRLIS